MKNNLTSHFDTPGALRHDARRLAEDAEHLLEATKGVVDEKVKTARQQLAETIDRGRDLRHGFEERAKHQMRKADETIHEHPYHTAFVALGVGALLGFLCSLRR